MTKLPNLKEITQYTPKESMERARKFMRTVGNKKQLKPIDFKVGNFLFLKYNAKDKTKVYDKNPLIMVLRRNTQHTLGLNFHWIPYVKRIELIHFIFSLNVTRVKNRKPLVFTYPQLKEFLKKRGYSPCIRLYINKRLSRNGFKVPNTQLLGFSRLNMMIFNNGKSAEEVYAMAVNKKI